MSNDNTLNFSTSSTNSVERKTSFVTKTTVFLEPERKWSNTEGGNSGSNPVAGNLKLDISDAVERVKFDSSSLPTSPTSEEVPSASSIAGGLYR